MELLLIPSAVSSRATSRPESFSLSRCSSGSFIWIYSGFRNQLGHCQEFGASLSVLQREGTVFVPQRGCHAFREGATPSAVGRCRRCCRQVLGWKVGESCQLSNKASLSEVLLKNIFHSSGTVEPFCCQS